MSNKDDEGKLELSLRILGNEIIGFKMLVQFGPMLMETFSGN